MSSESEQCRICRELPEWAHADRNLGESLPAAMRELEAIGDGVMKCPVCGAYYLHRYVYDYYYYGSDEDDYLDRIKPEEVIKLLMNVRELNDKVCRELDNLGINDAYTKIIERLTQSVDSVDSKDSKNERHYSLLTLVNHYYSTNPAKLNELLEHPDSWVRSTTLYFLMNKGANQVPSYVKRLSDPVADVRNHAGWALRSRAELGGDISDAMPALISTLAGDPVVDVRRQAADALAAAALQGTDISSAIPALNAALGVADGLTFSAAAALRNAAAKGTDISQAVINLRRCGEDEEPFHKKIRETALEALRLLEARKPGEGGAETDIA